MNYYQFHIGDFVRDTAHLTPLEDISYRRLLDLYYTVGGPIPDDVPALARKTRMTGHEDLISAVLEEFFVRTESGCWRNGRAEEEIAKTQAKSEAARQSVQSRWNKRPAEIEPENNERDTNVLRAKCDGNTPINQEPITNNQENPPLPPKGEVEDLEEKLPFDDEPPATEVPEPPQTLPATLSPWWWEVPGPATPEKKTARMLDEMRCKNGKPCFERIHATPEAVGRLVAYMREIDPGDLDLDLEVRSFRDWHERQRTVKYKDGPACLRKWLGGVEAKFMGLKKSRERNGTLGASVQSTRDNLEKNFAQIDAILEGRA